MKTMLFAKLVTYCYISNCQDGPDILVCDEAHVIKNTRADVTQALKQVKCQRRIALTGSPLQNNLMEYYCVSSLESYTLFYFLQITYCLDSFEILIVHRWLIL